MASKRKNDKEAANPQSSKRRKTHSNAQAAFDEDGEIRNADALRRSMEGEPRQGSVLTLDPRPFDEEAEIRRADDMRIAMQPGLRITPPPMPNSGAGGVFIIKQERRDSAFDESLASAVNIPGHISGVHAAFQHGDYQDLPLPFDDANVAADIETAAVILSRCNRNHPLFQPTLQNLRNICFPPHDVQVRSVVDRLVALGVQQAVANEVAAILRQRGPESVPLGEVAATLTNFEQLESVLKTLQGGAPSKAVQAQLLSWRNEVRDPRSARLNTHDHGSSTRAEAPDREFGNLISTETRGGSVFMSGGLGATVNASEQGDEQADHDASIKRESGSDMEAAGDFIHDREAALLHTPDLFADEMQLQFPDGHSLFLFHVLKASKAANILVARKDCSLQASELWRRFNHVQKKSWSRLVKSLRKGDLAALDPFVAEPLLSEHGLPGVIVPIKANGTSSDFSMGSDAGGDDSGFDSSPGGEGECESAQSDSAGDGEFSDDSGSDDSGDSKEELQDSVSPAPHQDSNSPSPQPALAVTALHGPDILPRVKSNKKMRKLIKKALVWYDPEHSGEATVMVVVRTPDCPSKGVNGRKLLEYCKSQLGGRFKALSTPTKLRTYSVLLDSRRSAQEALRQEAHLQVCGSRVYMEPLPRQLTDLLFCDLSSLHFAEEDLAAEIRRAFGPIEGGVELLRYPGGLYLVRLPKPRPILRAYVEVTVSNDEMCIARFRPADLARKFCPVCSKVHSWPCAQAEVVPLPPKVPKQRKQQMPSKKKRAEIARRGWQQRKAENKRINAANMRITAADNRKKATIRNAAKSRRKAFKRA